MVNDPYPREIVYMSSIKPICREAIQTFYNVPTVVGYCVKSQNFDLAQKQLHNFAHSLQIMHGTARINTKQNQHITLLLATPYEAKDLDTVVQAVEKQKTTDIENDIHWFKTSNIFHFDNLFKCNDCMFVIPSSLNCMP